MASQTINCTLRIKMEKYFRFRNFRQFERSHREIRLPYDLLNDSRFRRLADAHKGHLICLLILAVRLKNLLPRSAVKLEGLIGATEPLNFEQLAEFIDDGSLEKSSREEETANRRIPDDQRASILVRDGGRCRNCGTSRNLEIDHIIPLSKGGSSADLNLQTLCRRCNRRKWKKMIARL